MRPNRPRRAAEVRALELADAAGQLGHLVVGQVGQVAEHVGAGDLVDLDGEVGVVGRP